MTDTQEELVEPPSVDDSEVKEAQDAEQQQQQTVAEHAGQVAVDETAKEAQELRTEVDTIREDEQAVAAEEAAADQRSQAEQQQQEQAEAERAAEQQILEAAARQEAAEAAGRFATRGVATEPHAAEPAVAQDQQQDPEQHRNDTRAEDSGQPPANQGTGQDDAAAAAADRARGEPGPEEPDEAADRPAGGSSGSGGGTTGGGRGTGGEEDGDPDDPDRDEDDHDEDDADQHTTGRDSGSARDGDGDRQSPDDASRPAGEEPGEAAADRDRGEPGSEHRDEVEAEAAAEAAAAAATTAEPRPEHRDEDEEVDEEEAGATEGPGPEHRDEAVGRPREDVEETDAQEDEAEGGEGPEGGRGPTDRPEGDEEDVSRPSARNILYSPDGLARSAEALSPDDINRIYDETRPRSQTSVAAVSHDASRLLDLALSEQSGDVSSRLDLLNQAHSRYLESLYNISEDEAGKTVYEPRSGPYGKDEPIINNHAAQSRFTLDQWDLYRARVEDRDLSEEERTRVYINSAATLDSMRQATQSIVNTTQAIPNPRNTDLSREERREILRQGHAMGMLTESLAMATTARPPLNGNTFLATPTSEIRRLEGGPDAAIPMKYNREIDVDWKSATGKGATVVIVGNIAYRALGSDIMDIKPDTAQVREATLFVAELLVKESQGDTLNILEKSYLDTFQRNLCDAIDLNSSAMGIDDIRAEARFR